MIITKLDCPSCGAALTDMGTKYICEYCGKDVYIESKKLETVGNEIAKAGSKTQEAISTGSQVTQIELRRLQLTQELSMLEMQLSNLRSEKRRILLTEKKTKAHKLQVSQIGDEESNLLRRMDSIRSSLLPLSPCIPGKNSVAVGPLIIPTVPGNLKSQAVAFWLAALLGMFGAQRFYTGHIKLGILYLCTVGLMGFGYIFDISAIFFGKYKDAKGLELKPMGKEAKILATIFMILFILYFIGVMTNGGPSPTTNP